MVLRAILFQRLLEYGRAISKNQWKNARKDLEATISEFERFGGSRAQKTYLNLLI